MRAHFRGFSLCLLLGGAVASLSSAASAVTIDWTPVGNQGNACDVQSGQGCFGSVAYGYNIGTYEVTNSQYAEFLNAVADTDTNALYNTSMGLIGINGGITRIGGSGSYTYNAIGGLGDMPVNYVSFYDSLRFANWLDNGQLTGVQDSTTTEDGAYTFTGATSVGARNAGATIFLTSENEWYKAAYYDASSASYFNYPAGSDTQTVCASPSATLNTANCLNRVGRLTDVGSYTGSASPYGTFDQGGNVSEWSERVTDLARVRGGSLGSDASFLAASIRWASDPLFESRDTGFRVASIPEPGTGLLVMAGLLGLTCRRKRHT